MTHGMTTLLHIEGTVDAAAFSSDGKTLALGAGERLALVDLARAEMRDARP